MFYQRLRTPQTWFTFFLFPVFSDLLAVNYLPVNYLSALGQCVSAPENARYSYKAKTLVTNTSSTTGFRSELTRRRIIWVFSSPGILQRNGLGRGFQKRLPPYCFPEQGKSQDMCGLVSGNVYLRLGHCVDGKVHSQIHPLRKNSSPDVEREDQKHHLVVFSLTVCFNWWEPSQIRLPSSHVNLPPAYETKPDLGTQGQGMTGESNLIIFPFC